MFDRASRKKTLLGVYIVPALTISPDIYHHWLQLRVQVNDGVVNRLRLTAVSRLYVFVAAREFC